MEHNDDIRKFGFDQIKNEDVDYMDGNIAFHRDIKELPSIDGAIRIDMYLIAVCIKGKVQLDMNDRTFTLQHNDFLLCRPNVLITNCLMSPDYEGGMLCVSQRVITENFSRSDVWEQAFRTITSPVFHLDNDEAAAMYRIYGELLTLKSHNRRQLYRKEIVGALVNAIIYEVLSLTGSYEPTIDTGMIKQSDVIFRRFIKMLADLPVKPRSVSWYAGKLCITPKHLTAVCRQTSGKTAMEWIYEYVLVDIRYYLKNTDKSIKEVADLLDFPNISFFGKYCRQHFGMSPKAFRRQLRGQPATT